MVVFVSSNRFVFEGWMSSLPHSDVFFSLLSHYSAFVLFSVSHFIVPHPLRHTNNNYFLNAYRHIWLEIMHENTDYDSLLSMLTVMLR